MSLQSLTLRIHDLDKSAEQAKDLDIPFFFAFPFNSFYDVRYAIDIGVSEIYVEAPLFFELDKVKLLNIPVRAVPNVANLSSWTFRREIAPYGTWIRPEDLKYYEDFIDTIEFQSPWTRVLPREEETCYRLYHDEQNWPGDLSMLIKDLGIQAINRLIPEGELKRRLTCGQRCQENGTCHLCQRVLDLASNIKELEEYQQLKENNQLRNIDDIQEEEENGEGV